MYMVDGIYGIYGIYGIKDTCCMQICEYVKKTLLELGFICCMYIHLPASLSIRLSSMALIPCIMYHNNRHNYTY
jgi:hypothetical protein